MARLSNKKRKGLPTSDFGLPGQRAYPMPDKAHARVAKAYATRYASPSQKAEIDAKANKVLGKSDAFSRARTQLKKAAGAKRY